MNLKAGVVESSKISMTKPVHGGPIDVLEQLVSRHVSEFN